MLLSFQQVQVDTSSADQDGHLVFADDRLVAVLVRLSEQHDNLAGHWFIEATFGRLGRYRAPIFPSMEQAQAWIEERLTSAAVPA